MVHECELRVRSYECDSYGHVNNAVYLNYLEYARISFLEAIGLDYQALRARGYGLVVVRICIDYRLPTRTGDRLRIVTRPLSRQRVRAVFDQRIYRDGDEVAAAEVTWACLDERGRPARLPAELDVPELIP